MLAGGQAYRLDVGAGGLRHPEPVQCQQGDQRMLGRGAEAGRDEQGANLVSVQARGVGLVVQPGPSDVDGRRVIEQVFLDGVAIEPGDRAQPAGDRRMGPAPAFQVPSETLDVGTAGTEQPDVMLAASGRELTQV